MNPFEKILERFEDLRDGLLTTNTEYNSNLIDAMMRAGQIVHEVAEEYKDGWIPCIERLPEKIGRYYIVSIKSAVSELSYSIPALYEKDGFYTKIDEEVIAWQPLPEPFKERD